MTIKKILLIGLAIFLLTFVVTIVGIIVLSPWIESGVTATNLAFDYMNATHNLGVDALDISGFKPLSTENSDLWLVSLKDQANKTYVLTVNITSNSVSESK